MEKVLQTVAHRVVTTNLNEEALRHTYDVHLRRRTKQTKLADALSSVGDGLSLLAVERLSLMHTESAAWGYNANQIVCRLVPNHSTGMDMRQLCIYIEVSGLAEICPLTYVCCIIPTASPTSRLMSRTQSNISVSFHDWVVQLSHRLVLTRGISVRSYASLVRVSFRYEDRLTDPTLFPGSVSTPKPGAQSASGGRDQLEDEESDVNGKYVDPRTADRNKKLLYFASSQRITHAVLSISPCAISTTEVVPPAELSFDLHSMRHLLRDHAPADFDEMVADGKQRVLFNFASRLASLVRLECTNGGGVIYTVVGAFSEPPHETCGWPRDVPRFMDEDLEDILLPDEAAEVAVEPPPTSPIPMPVETQEREDDLAVEMKETECEFAVEASSEPLLIQVEEEEEEEVKLSSLPPPPSSPTAVLLPLQLREDCPIHPVLCSMSPDSCGCPRTHCKCTRQLVTLKGSEVVLWADFSEIDAASGLLDADAPDLEARETLRLPSTLDAMGFLSCGHSLQSVNALKIVAVDQVDMDLSCEVILRAEKVADIVSRACTASKSCEEVDCVEGILRVYAVPLSGAVQIDLMQHPALRRLCVDFICDNSLLDLFLSRKSKLMKLIVK